VSYVSRALEETSKTHEGMKTTLESARFKTEQTLTKDNAPVVVGAVMYFQPVDLQKVVLGAES
jgi:regulator of protease activity HflC (stomatin/prohibitin superfamily)